MTIRAHHAWFAEARADRTQGVDGDALAMLDAVGYRKLIVVLEEFVADLESRAADVYRTLLPNGTSDSHGRNVGGRAIAKPVRATRVAAPNWYAETTKTARSSRIASADAQGPEKQSGPATGRTGFPAACSLFPLLVLSRRCVTSRVLSLGGVGLGQWS